MLLLLGSRWKQKDKVPQVCMQILEWCIAMNIINEFESLHEFIEAKKSCLGHVSVMVTRASLKALLIWRCRAGSDRDQPVCCDTHHGFWASVLWSQTLGVGLSGHFIQQDISGFMKGHGKLVGLSSEFDLVKTMVWCSPVWLSFTAPGLNCHVSVCETSGFVLSAPDSRCDEIWLTLLLGVSWAHLCSVQ